MKRHRLLPLALALFLVAGCTSRQRLIYDYIREPRQEYLVWRELYEIPLGSLYFTLAPLALLVGPQGDFDVTWALVGIYLHPRVNGNPDRFDEAYAGWWDPDEPVATAEAN